MAMRARETRTRIRVAAGCRLQSSDGAGCGGLSIKGKLETVREVLLPAMRAVFVALAAVCAAHALPDGNNEALAVRDGACMAPGRPPGAWSLTPLLGAPSLSLAPPA